jgi:hypothetical protein
MAVIINVSIIRMRPNVSEGDLFCVGTDIVAAAGEQAVGQQGGQRFKGVFHLV